MEISVAHGKSGRKTLYGGKYPVNTQATVFIPAKSELDISMDDQRLDLYEDLQKGHFFEGKQVLKLGSGTYRFESTIK